MILSLTQSSTPLAKPRMAHTRDGTMEVHLDAAGSLQPEISNDIPQFAMDALTSMKAKRDKIKSSSSDENEDYDHQFVNDTDEEDEETVSSKHPSYSLNLTNKSSLHVRSSASNLNKTQSNLFAPASTPQYETFETTFADINDSEDEFLDDDEVDDDDYEYYTDESWVSDDNDPPITAPEVDMGPPPPPPPNALPIIDDEEPNDSNGHAKDPTVILNLDDVPMTRPIARSVTFAADHNKAIPKKPGPNIGINGRISLPQNPDNLSVKAKSYGASLKEFRHFKIRSVTIYGNLLLGDLDKKDTKIRKYRTKNEKSSPKKQTISSILDEKNDDDKKSNGKKDDCEIKRNHIKREIIETEKSYLKGLQCLLHEFIMPIFTQKMIPRKYEKDVTSIIPTIINFHIQFLQDLTAEYEKGEEGNMPAVFIKCAAFLKMYIDYIREYQHILDIFGKHQKSKKLKKYLKQKRKERKPLTNHLILPIQRVPRYMLLLEDLKKKTPEQHQKYQTLSEALEIITNVANSINERKREIENMSQCLQVMENLRELNRNIVEPHRKFLNQFLFRKKDNQRPRQFFVFSDLIIITNLKMKVKMILDMRTIDLKKQKSTHNGSSGTKPKQTVQDVMLMGYERSIGGDSDDKDMNEFILYTAKGKPIIYETDLDKVDDVIELNELIIKSRLQVWDGDLSRLEDGKSATRKALKQTGVSHGQQFRNQLDTIQRLREKKDENALNTFRTSSNTKGKKNKVLEMLGQ